MTFPIKTKSFIAASLLSAFTLHHQEASATNLSLGADYRLRAISIEERLTTMPDSQYYEQRLQAYLITDLSKDVEATIRIQSLSPWGLENSTSSLSTRYPDANGDLWVQNAFVRMPNIWKDRITLTLGRQPLAWGDGLILSDDELGFNAVRAQIKSPFRWLPVELDVFSAKIKESLRINQDTDLHGAKVDFDRKSFHWEVMGLFETNKQVQAYNAGASTIPFTASKIERNIYGARAKTRVKDAFIKGEYYIQEGEISRSTQTAIKLGGDAWVIGLGANSRKTKFGRFGAILEFMEGSGDDVETSGDDEAFRPTFTSRWDGLERKGMGRYFASTFSDVYSSTSPFADASSINDGLPEGTSGIQTIHFGVEATPWAKWTFTFDYYTYKALKNLLGSKDLGTEFDYGFLFRYSGLVTLKGNLSDFRPGDAFDPTTKQDASFGSLEVDLHF